MKSDLQILIDELQKEFDLLEKEMNACIKEMDFLGAEAFRKAFVYTQNKLRILRHLENSNFDKINSLKHKIKYIKELRLENFNSEYVIEIMKKQIPEYEKELEELENKERNIHLDKDELIVFLEKIDTGELTNFEIEMEKGYIILKVFREKNGIGLQLKTSDNKSLRYATTSYGFSEVKKMGFEITEEDANLSIDKFDKTKIPFVMEILSRLVYDVFRLYRDRNKTVIIKY